MNVVTIKLDKSEYTTGELMKLLGVNKHKMWRLKNAVGIKSYVKGLDRRQRYISLDDAQRLVDFVNGK